jgi:hypothetical protein
MGLAWRALDLERMGLARFSIFQKTRRSRSGIVVHEHGVGVPVGVLVGILVVIVLAGLLCSLGLGQGWNGC